MPPFLVEFRERLTDEFLGVINEMIIAYNTPDDPELGSASNLDTDKNNGTLILDTTCAPRNISFLQDAYLSE